MNKEKDQIEKSSEEQIIKEQSSEVQPQASKEQGSQDKKKKKKDKRNKKKFGYEIFFVGLFVICFGLLSMIILLIKEYSSVLNEQAQTKAEMNAAEALKPLDERLNKIKYQAIMLADKISGKPDDEDVYTTCLHIVASDEFGTNLAKIVWCKDGVIYSMNGNNYESDANDEIISASASKEVKILGVIFDSEDIMERFAISVPVADNETIDSVVFIYSLSALWNLKQDTSQEIIKQASVIAFCRSSGKIMEVIYNKDSLIEPNNDLITGLRKITGKKEDADNLSSMLAAEDNGVFLVTISGDSYAVAVAKNQYCSDLGFVILYRAKDIYSSTYDFVSIILTSFIVIIILLVVFAAYFMIMKRNIKKQIDEFGTKNEQIGCLTRYGFELETNKAIEKFPNTKFAIIVAGIRRFEYIVETFGQDRANELLKEMKSIINRELVAEEVLGCDTKGEFLALMLYSDDEKIIHRLRHLYGYVYKTLSNKDYNVRLNFGICVVEQNKKNNISKLISNAEFAIKESGLERMDGNYTIYNDKIKSKFMEISGIEGKMEKGINEKEFKVFYQPKYNVNGDCMDGCEALVRWYDKESNKFRPPNTFLPLLEENGYISVLDHHIFREVCKFINSCADRGIPMIPVSVNVSRLTMLEKDFVNDYIKIKEENEIPDNFLTLEFTESAAYENNEFLAEISKTLRAHGFLCSIDDFGTGYSSYNMLKVLDMDEVKLDRFFIENCLSSERARYIIEGAVSTANKLKIKVTQEGVEDSETFNYLKKIGCDVIQGYYYSKPLPEEEFLKFINEHLHWNK